MLSECDHNGWGVHNCDHTADVGVICWPGLTVFMHLCLNLCHGKYPTAENFHWAKFCCQAWAPIAMYCRFMTVHVVNIVLSALLAMICH